MRKCTIWAVLSTMMLSLIVSTGSQAAERITGYEEIGFNDAKGVPTFVVGEFSKRKVNNADDALAIMQENHAMFNIESATAELKLFHESRDELGHRTFKFKQAYKGIPVFGNELIVHGDQQGNVTSVNGYFDPGVRSGGLQLRPTLSKEQAVAVATKSFDDGAGNQFDISKSDLTIYQSRDNVYHLVYVVTVTTLTGEHPCYADVFVDAHTGDIISTLKKIEHVASVGSGTGVLGDRKPVNTDSYLGGYYLRDITKPMYASGGKIETYNAGYRTTLPGTLFSDVDNIWDDPAAVDAHVYSGLVYDYYKNKHNRNSYDNNGATIKSTVHYGNRYNNAFWNGSQMVYGDGDGSTFAPLSGALDVVGHEITHGVIERTAGLVYSYQSGALNESFADVFGNLIENRSDELWLVGEDVYTPHTPGDALRSMSNPPAYGDPGHMNQYVVTSSDNGGVHTNSGIPNKAFFNFVTTSGVTRDEAGKVWYRALTQYMTSNSQFIDARNATIQAAVDLFGPTSLEVSAVTNAWSNVGIGSGNAPGDTYEPNDSMAGAYGLQSGTYNALISTSTDVDWYKFAVTQPGTLNLTLSKLPKDYDLTLYNSAGAVLARSWKPNLTNEAIAYNATSAGTYYLKVTGYRGVYSITEKYELGVSVPGSSAAEWKYQPASYNTPHPYVNRGNYSHTYSQPGAEKVSVRFSKLETETNFDFVYIKDKNGRVVATYHGSKQPFRVVVDGDTVTVNLVTDFSVVKYGYTIDEVGYYDE